MLVEYILKKRIHITLFFIQCAAVQWPVRDEARTRIGSSWFVTDYCARVSMVPRVQVDCASSIRLHGSHRAVTNYCLKGT